MPKDLEIVEQGKNDAIRTALAVALQSAPLGSLRIIEEKLDSEIEARTEGSYLSYIRGIEESRDQFKAAADAVDRIGDAT